jgi:hypothetical protein
MGDLLGGFGKEENCLEKVVKVMVVDELQGQVQLR